MDDKKFKSIRNFIVWQTDIANKIVGEAVPDYEEEFDHLAPEEKAEYGWSIDDQQVEAEAKGRKIK